MPKSSQILYGKDIFIYNLIESMYNLKMIKINKISEDRADVICGWGMLKGSSGVVLPKAGERLLSERKRESNHPTLLKTVNGP